jgi:hypothetical protein
MLEICAPGYARKLREHNWLVTWNGRSFPNLPKYPEIQIGHVRKMARSLGIVECARQQLPQLR